MEAVGWEEDAFGVNVVTGTVVGVEISTELPYGVLVVIVTVVNPVPEVGVGEPGGPVFSVGPDGDEPGGAVCGVCSVGPVYSGVDPCRGVVDTDISQPINCMQNPFFLSEANFIGMILTSLATIGPLGRKNSSRFEFSSFP
jgi:hypothetical protein